MFMERPVNAARILAVVMLAVTLAQSQQQLSSLDRGRAQDMLRTVASEVRKHYYDPKFHGVDWDAKVVEAKQKIDKTTSMNMALSHIAAALDTLGDSHTFFVPPGTPTALSTDCSTRWWVTDAS